MKIAGIISEYNPFHNGHAYHLKEVRKKTNADYIIIVMSGNFMQRGVPAMLNKYQRAKMALMNGADLVLELPCLFACSSAEFFAKGAISIFHQLGVIDFLGFGCENNNLSLLQKVVNLLLEEPEAYRNKLQNHLRNGCSFPAARSMALKSCLGNDYFDNLLTSPNNILAIEYLKSLQTLASPIQPIAIKREGAAYSDAKLNNSYSSALAIRSALFNTQNTGQNLDNLKGHVPDSVLSLLQEEYLKTMPVTTDDFSNLLHYKLLLEKEKGYTEYLDISKDLSDKIKKNLHSYTNFDSFCMLLKSKELTYTRICRCMLHILLNIKQNDLAALSSSMESDLASFSTTGSNCLPAPYARILGFRNDSSPLLKELKANSKIPLLSVAADAKNFMADEKTLETAKKMLQLDITASRIYNGAIQNRYNILLPDEFGAPLLKV